MHPPGHHQGLPRDVAGLVRYEEADGSTHLCRETKPEGKTIMGIVSVSVTGHDLPSGTFSRTFSAMASFSVRAAANLVLEHRDSYNGLIIQGLKGLFI